MGKVSYRDFSLARKFSRKLGIQSASQWRHYSCSSERPIDIPSHPDRQYKNCGWLGWMDWLNTNNKQGGNRKYFVNDAYFSQWSHNMAYILGFWFADGYMDEKKGIFSITQHKKDGYLMRKILKEMKSNFPLKKHDKNSLCFRITSHKIAKDIQSLGGMQAKSYKIEFPNVPSKYLPDFIRGLWDGDGCVCFQKNEKCYVSSFVSASKIFACELLETMRREILNFKGTINLYNGVWILSVGVNDTRRLRDYLYQNIPSDGLFLKRKYDKFMKSGDIRIASFDLQFLSYEEAQKFIQKKGIKKYKEWRQYKKTNNVIDIPASFERTYKGKGWVDWETVAGTKFWSFEKARKYVRGLNLNGSKEWKKYASSDKRIDNIPSNPWGVYVEWDGLKDWLG